MARPSGPHPALERVTQHFNLRRYFKEQENYPHSVLREAECTNCVQFVGRSCFCFRIYRQRKGTDGGRKHSVHLGLSLRWNWRSSR